MKLQSLVALTIIAMCMRSSFESELDCSEKYELAPLYLVSPNFCTISEREISEFLIKIGTVQQTILAMAATNSLDCTGKANLRPVYRFYNEPTLNYFYSTDSSPNSEYSFDGIAFYAATTLNECGAAIPLHKYFLKSRYVFTTDKTNGKAIINAGGRYDGIVCYVWPNETQVTTPPPDENCPVNPVTLLRLFRSETDNHFYTNSETEAQNSVTSLNYVREQSPGRIVLSASDCSCGKNFIAIHRLYKIDRNGSKEDHLYTNSTQESYNAVNGLGYIRESVGFYCSPNQFYCGATIPLYRYYRGFDHFYTTDLDEGNESIKSTGGKYEGILCYIWPSDVTPVMVPQPAKSCPLNSVPLLRLYRKQSRNHFYTNSEFEAQNAVTTLQYDRQQSPGRIVLSASDCSCADNFVPVYRLYKRDGSIEDHFYTDSDLEANDAATKLGYTRVRIEFYCSPTQSLCGATLPLFRYYFGTNHFYTTDWNEGAKNVVSNGGKYEGILCYIWP